MCRRRQEQPQGLPTDRDEYVGKLHRERVQRMELEGALEEDSPGEGEDNS